MYEKDEWEKHSCGGGGAGEGGKLSFQIGIGKFDKGAVCAKVHQSGAPSPQKRGLSSSWCGSTHV